MDEKLSRRDFGKMAAATAGAATAVWAIPEILTAQSAGGATLSTPAGPSALNGSLTPDEAPIPGTPSHTTPANGSLPFTGADLQTMAEAGAVLVAGGWAMHHWAARRGAASVVEPD